MKINTVFFLFLSLLFLNIAGCGSGHSNNNAGLTGPSLHFAGTVTTVAGTYGSADATGGPGTAARLKKPYGITTDGTNLYIADSENYTIRKIVISTGAVTTLAGSAGMHGSTDGTGTAARFYLPYAVTTDGTNIYVADAGNNSIRKIVISSGVVTTLAVGFNFPQGISTDGTNLYVADTGNNTIKKIVISTGAITTLAGNGNGSADGSGHNGNSVGSSRFNNPAGVTLDETQTILYVADAGNNTIRKINLSAAPSSMSYVTTLAGTAGRYGSTDAIGTAARFNLPIAVASDGSSLYITDSGNDTIRKIVISGGVGTVTTMAGTAGRTGSMDGTGPAASFNCPYAVTSDGTSLFVADAGNNTIRKIVISSGEVTTLAGNISNDGGGLKPSEIAAAGFNNPSGIAYYGQTLYVADTDNNTIRKIDLASGIVTTLAGTTYSSGADDTGTGSTPSFNKPYGIATDGHNIYVADTGNNTIRQITFDGKVSTLAGQAGAYGSADGIGSEARFNGPTGITVVGTNLYVVENFNDRIRKINISTGTVTSLTVTDGAGSAVSLDPTGITSDGTSLYVTDSGNYLIRKIVISTGVASNLATLSHYADICGLTTDGTNLYVADSQGNTIRRINIAAGAETTLAGSGSAGSADGVGTAATFNGPKAIATDGKGLYVTDSGNNMIRKIN